MREAGAAVGAAVDVLDGLVPAQAAEGDVDREVVGGVDGEAGDPGRDACDAAAVVLRKLRATCYPKQPSPLPVRPASEAGFPSLAEIKR